MKRKKLNLKNAPDNIIEAINNLEGYGFECEVVRQLPADATLEEIEEAVKEDASGAFGFADAVDWAAQKLDSQAGPYADHKLF